MTRMLRIADPVVGFQAWLTSLLSIITWYTENWKLHFFFEKKSNTLGEYILKSFDQKALNWLKIMSNVILRIFRRLNFHQKSGVKLYFCLPLTWNSTIGPSIMPTHRLGLCVCWMGYSKTWMTDDWTYRVQSPHKGAFPFLESFDGKLDWLSVQNFLPNFNICT